MRTSMVWKINCNIIFMILELSSQGTLNHLSKLDSQHSLLIHYNNN
ncbi:hypothetical protein PFMC_04584 [Plasmodium falciparum CAMP/Malaysia]|uniref:Uncharacterized protein n=1 Tax=Plasmodium falciparum (isolate Camp / Malaysia) TaxID=5835 RepID=A0A024X3A9_PLAFC|nr:hypothetical protein PFMC_04584 [Plasmodium falciparum CAMP/Malaysia]